MKKYIYIVLNAFSVIFINWVSYYLLRKQLNTGQLVAIVVISLISCIIASVIKFKKINIANYWVFAKKYPFLYGFIGNMITFMLIYKINVVYKNIGIGLFVIINTILLLLYLIDEEDRKRRKERNIKSREDSERFL